MNLGEIQHLLPRSVRTMIAIIGIEATTRLIMTMPGVPFLVPKALNSAGKARFEELAECVGREAAALLSKHFGGEVIEIPTCRRAIVELRRRQIRADFTTLTTDNSARYAIARLAIKYQMTGRHVREIVNLPDEEPSAASQLSLL